jgi:thiamine-phosphate pyrophosphorylase
VAPVPLPRLHAVTDDTLLARADFTALARRVLEAGGGRVALHLRGRATAGARLYALAMELREEARRVGGLLVVNDRIDVALVAELDGVHLGRASLPAALVRRLLPGGRWVGASVHGADVARAVSRDADYLVLGTVFATASHPDRRGAGTELVARVRAATSLPLLAIGGVTPIGVSEVLEAGADGVAALSGIWRARDPGAAVLEYLGRLPEGAPVRSPASGEDFSAGTVDGLSES